MTRNFVWLSIGGGAWSLGTNWSDVTDGSSPAAFAPGVADNVTIAGPSAASVQTITAGASSPGLAASALLFGDTLLSGSFDIGALTLGQAGAGGLLELAGATALATGTASVVSGSLLVGAGASLADTGSFNLGLTGDGSATFNVTGGGQAAVASLFLGDAGSSIYVDATSVLEVGGAGSGSAGKLTVDANAALSGQGAADAYGQLANSGTISAQGGTLLVGAVSGSGTLLIGTGATLALNGACGAGQTVSFTGSGATLALEAEYDAPAGTLTGFAAGDAIDVRGSQISAASYQQTGAAAGVLSLVYGTQTALTLTLAGSYAGCVFLATGDGDGGTLVTVAASTSGGNGGPPSGTATPDFYAWGGAATGRWGAAALWSDASRNQASAAVAPGANDLVSIAGAQSAFTVIAGPGNAAALAVTGNVALSGAFNVGILTVGQASGTPGALNLTAGALTASQASIEDGAVAVSGAGVTLGVAGTLTLGGGPSGVGLPTAALSASAGAAVQATYLVLGGGSGASITTDPTGSVEVGIAGGAQAGAVSIDAGATLAGNGSVDPYGVVVDNGAVFATGGTLSLGAVSGTGSLVVDAGATLELLAATAEPITLNGTAASGAVLAFAGAQSAPSGTITGFVPGDAIDLEGSPLTSVTLQPASDTLLLFYGTTIVARLALSGSFANERFLTAPDGAEGTLISLVAGTGGGSPKMQTGTDQLTWTSPVSGAWGTARNWTDTTIGAQASLPPGAQTPVQITGGGGIAFADVTSNGTCASLSAAGNVVLSGSFGTGQLAVSAAGTLVLQSAVSATQVLVTGGELLTSGAGNGLADQGMLALSDAAAAVGAQDRSTIQCGALALAGGAVTADATSSVEVGTLGGAALGAVTIDPGAVASGAGSIGLYGLVVDDGAVTAAGGTLWLGTVVGSGALSIGTEATLALAGTDTCLIAFAGGGGTLLLEQAALHADLVVSGFTAGEAIDIASTPVDSLSWQPGSSGPGTLSLIEAGQTVGQLLLTGNFAGEAFSLQPDGSGGSQIVLSPAIASGPPPGTATPDSYVWTGAQNTTWSNAANWTDTSTGQTPAGLAPGQNDLVSVAGGILAPVLVDGEGDAAWLGLSGTVSLSGSYALGTLAVGALQQPGLLALGSTAEVGAACGQVAGGVALAGGTLSVSGTLALGQPGGIGGVLLAEGASLTAVGALTLAGTASDVETDATGCIAVCGLSGQAGALVAGQAGGADAGQAGAVSVAAGGVISGAGSLALSGLLVDQGVVAASGGTLVVGNVSGGGTLLVGVGAELVLGGTASAGLTVDFAGGGTLSLCQADLAGSLAIAGFGAGDEVVLAASGATTASYAQTSPDAGVVTIDDGTAILAQLTLLGSQDGVAFNVAGSAGGGTILTSAPDSTSAQGGTFMTNPLTSGGTLLTSVMLEQDLQGVLPYAEADLNNVLANRTTYEWWSVDGLPAGPAFTFSTTVVSVEVVAPLPVQTGGGNGPGSAVALQSGYSALLLEGSENMNVTDGGLGNALIAGNYGSDAIAALGDGDTLVGATGANTVFYAGLESGKASAVTGHDVTIRGGGNDTIATNSDAALVYTSSFGRSLVFLGAPQSESRVGNDVQLNGADTVICSSSGLDNITVNAAAGQAGDFIFGPPSGTLNFVGGNTPSTIVGGAGGQLVIHGGAANGSLFWAGASNLDYVGGGGAASIVGGSGQTQVQGGSGAVTVFGGTGAGEYSGGAGSDFIVGQGASTVQAAGGGGVVFLVGGANAVVNGTNGAVVSGGASAGNDVFNAGAGQETLFGGHGTDTFTGGTGSAVLASSGGTDTFSFTNGQGGGHDYLLNFNPGQDVIDLNGYGGADPTINYAFGDSILNLQDGTQVVVIGVSHLTDASLRLG